MSLSLSTLISLLEGDKVFESELSDILYTVANSTLISEAPDADINHLCSRVNNYLLSKKLNYRWIGCRLCLVLTSHARVLLSGKTVDLLGSLIKILESKCYVENPASVSQQQIAVLNSCCEATQFLVERLRPKPALTREVLTPKLPAIIAALIGVAPIVPAPALSILTGLLKTNSTTFRPFGGKLDTLLGTLIESDPSLVLKPLALSSFCLSRENPAEQWRTRLRQLLQETKSVLMLYQEILDTGKDEDLDGRLASLPAIPPDFSPIFGVLRVDIVETPLDVLKISQRVALLVEFITVYLEVGKPYGVKVPVGQLVTLSQLLTGLNLKFAPISSDIRDPTTRQLIGQSLIRLNRTGVSLIRTLVDQFGDNMLPFFYTLVSSLDACIPVKYNKGKVLLDKAEITSLRKDLVTDVIQSTSALLGMVQVFSDNGLLNRMVDAALLVTQPLLPDLSIFEKAKGDKNSKKKKGKGVSMSDLISHGELFTKKVAGETLAVVRRFFSTALSHCQLTTSNATKILRFAVFDALDNKKDTSLLETALLYPDHQGVVVSIIPMIYSLLGDDNRIASLLNNPRLPVPRVVYNNVRDDGEEEDEEEDVEDEDEVKEVKEESVKRQADPIQPPAKRIHTNVQAEADSLAEKQKEVEIEQPVTVEETYVKPTEVEKEEETPDEPSADEDSDFEMPPIIAD